jgi:ATP-binding cassette subfamily B protein
MVAVVGPTGAGKAHWPASCCAFTTQSKDRYGSTTVTSAPTKLDSVIDQISVVLQEPLLFQASIRENIAYGKLKASLKEIEEAARIAYCDEFIDKLPEGLDTVVGERGTTLSGGQRQRIAIARAVIRDAPILIFDEPPPDLTPKRKRWYYAPSNVW